MDVTILADALAPVLRDLVDASVAPLVARFDASEKRVAELEAERDSLVNRLCFVEGFADTSVAKREFESLADRVAAVEKVPTTQELALEIDVTKIKVAVDEAVAGITVDFDEVGRVVDERLAKALDALPKVPTAEEVASLVQAPPTAEAVAALIPPPVPGKDADPEATAAMVRDAAAALMTPMQVAMDAAITDVRAATEAATTEMKEAIAALPAVPTAAEVAALVPVAKDGKDVDLDVVHGMVVDEVSVAVAALPPAASGKDASPEAIDAAVEKYLATWERPKDGRSVTVEDVMPALQERLDKAVAALPAAKDGIGLAGLLIDSGGVLVGTLTDGSLHKLGPVRGKDGLDGLSDGDFELIDGATEFTVRLTRGDQTKEWKIAKPTLADMHKGIWHDGPYKRGDVVTWGGSQWLAMVDTETKPETTKDWVLVVKRGRDGKDLTAAEPKPSKTVKL